MGRLGLVVLVALCQLLAAGKANDAADGTELVLTFLVHRHGNRSPTTGSLIYSNDIPALTEAAAPYGYGQLTNSGKQTAYKLGQNIRARYDDVLPDKYNSSIIYIRSTDSTRTKMTVLTAMAAVFPPTADSWSQEINWVPVPYTTVPARYDPNLAFIDCPVFIEAYSALSASQSPSMDQYAATLELLSNEVGINVTQYPALAYSIYDLYTAQESLEVPLSDVVQENFPAIREAAGGAIDMIFGHEDYIALQAGVLLNEFFEVAGEAIVGNDTQVVRIYSAHDYNVFSFESVTRVPRQGVPKYGAAYALELRKVTATGQFVVLPVYFPSPDEDSIYLQINGCDLLCDIEQFYDITSKYALTETEWATQCDFDPNADIDDSSIN